MTDICNIVQVGHEGITQHGERFVILDFVPKKGWKVKFTDEFGAELYKRADVIRVGKFHNPYRASSYGIGRIGVCTYTHKERTFWRRLIEKYSQGKLPHFNPRWLVLEFWLEDTRRKRDYDIFLSRKGYTLFDPFMRYDNIDHIIVSEDSTFTRGVVVKDLFTGEYEVYQNRFECSWQTGYCANSVFLLATQQATRDGMKFYFADEFAELYFKD